uniref:Gypsy retrotransposon integrase-like protein 1 n=1 Tax=Oreochromis niloticus TaxID=8128 RepID=A0A669CBL6_ORENI
MQRCDPEVEEESRFKPFLSQGFASVAGKEDRVPITILRDTGAHQSFMLDDVLPLSDKTACHTDVLVWGIEMNVLWAPLHRVYLHSPITTGPVKVAIRRQLPFKGVSFILGNDLAGEKVFPPPEVTDTPVAASDVTEQKATVFPVCAVTRAQPRKFADVISIADTFVAGEQKPCVGVKDSVGDKCSVLNLTPALSGDVNKEALISAQENDRSLSPCFAAVAMAGESILPRFFLQDGVLMRRWSSDQSGTSSVTQVVVPSQHRDQVLSLAHDAGMAGHLGVNKTYYRVLRNFFWPGLKKHVAAYCRSCATCQLVGKPNKPIPPAPLSPIPVMSEPFEKVILDCVGPLPRRKAGNQYILTIMCSATRFPEAIPLRTVKAKAVIKALIRFFSVFGLPKIIQTDQGTNFMSRVFAQVVDELHAKHVTSSPYHPESQGALERFHQTLKVMLRKFCLESGKEWDEGLPLLLFAIREARQESLGFSPAELVFGHVVRGPHRLLREKWLSEAPEEPCSVHDYVSQLRDRLRLAWKIAGENLKQVQTKMKARFDKKAVDRSFQPGEKVLLLLPVVGSSLSTQFAGPYSVERKLDNSHYVIRTPNRRRKTRVCHVNTLKLFHPRKQNTTAHSVCAVATLSAYKPSDDGLSGKEDVLGSGLKNSVILNDLESFVAELPEAAQTDIITLIKDNLSLFSDHPRQTTVLCHDIDVEGHKPIKQHAYRVNPLKREIMQREVNYLLEHGLAVPSASAWSSPCVLVPKSDNTPQFCTDYRKVNAATKADSFPLPRMDDCVDRVGSATYVTKLDLLKGYWQLPLTARASEISAFVTPDHFLQYTVMPFGLRNAPATFQRLMAKVLAGVPNCDAYLDDVVIYSASWSSHLQTLSTVFRRFEEASLTVNLTKCEFGKATITYLGKQVGHGRVCPVTAKVEAIIEYPVPQTRRALRRFLGMCGYYRGFCKNFASVVAPLTDLVSPTKSFTWTAACQTAFESVKALLCSAPVLAAPNFDSPFKLEVDASATAAGAILLQADQHGVDRPICYFSKKFNQHQINYSTIEKEALALLLALQHFEVYLGSSSVPIQVFTDHNPLVFLLRMQNSNQRLMRWSLLLQDFNLQISHKKGLDNVFADALSRAV